MPRRGIPHRQRDTAAVFAVTNELLRRAVESGFGSATGRLANATTALVEKLPSTGGGSFNTTVQRVSGPGNNGPWSVIVKRIDADPARPDWAREADVYADGAWLKTALPDGLQAPRLLASERSDDGVTLVLEDFPRLRELNIEDFASAARLLTDFSTSDHEARPWWSVEFLATEFHELADHPARLKLERFQPHLEELRQQLSVLSADAPRLLDACQALPHGPAHLDAYSRNLIVDPAADAIGLVDWANAGSAPLGTDPATLFILSLNYLDADVISIGELEDAITGAMHSRLTSSHASTRQASEGFHAVVRLRHLAMMMNAFPMVERADPSVSAIVGRPLDEIVEQWLSVGDHLLSER